MKFLLKLALSFLVNNAVEVAGQRLVSWDLHDRLQLTVGGFLLNTS